MAKKQTDETAETAATGTETPQADEQTENPATTETTTPEASGETTPESTVGTEPATETAPAERKAPAETAAPEVTDVNTLIAARHLPRWMGESIKVFAGWKTGKAVTIDEFNTAVDGWNKRNQGAGRRA